LLLAHDSGTVHHQNPRSIADADQIHPRGFGRRAP
jgi:hypothetical protein